MKGTAFLDTKDLFILGFKAKNNDMTLAISFDCNYVEFHCIFTSILHVVSYLKPYKDSIKVLQC